MDELTTPDPEAASSYDCLRCGRRVMRQGIKTDEGWFHLGCHKDDEIQRRRSDPEAAR